MSQQSPKEAHEEVGYWFWCGSRVNYQYENTKSDRWAWVEHLINGAARRGLTVVPIILLILPR